MSANNFAKPTRPIEFNVDAEPSLAQMSRLTTVRPVQAIASASNFSVNAVPYADLVKTLTVSRRFNLTQIRANPRLTLAMGRVDLSPVLSRQGTLQFAAEQLRSRADLGSVRVQDVEVSEVRRGTVEGLLVRSFLNYQLKSGACSGSNRSRVEALGIRCAKVIGISASQYAAAFADPKNPHYVADPAQRQVLVAKAVQDAKIQQAEVLSNVANFRASLTGGLGRGELSARLGDPEVNRLASLSDDALAAELINTGENKVEQVMFIPRSEIVTPLAKGRLATLVASSPKQDAAPPILKKVETEADLPETTYLTGFTLGKAYDWGYRVETTIKWCLVGCKKTYYVEVGAGLSYGFGLRFPIKVGGKFRYEGEQSGSGLAKNGKASFTPQFAPFDGLGSDYAATGLPQDKVFAGKELVAEAKAYFRFDAHIPVYPDPPAFRVEIGKDFTELLKAPFANGNLRPPAEGKTEGGSFVLTQFDLLGGQLNFGILGAQVFPAVEIGLTSNNLSFDLRDNFAGATRPNIKPGQAISLSLDDAQNASFAIERPLYNVGFVITPGINLRMFIDIGVWGKNWDFPLFFPSLTIEVPKNGVNFACHEGTRCSHSFKFSATGKVAQSNGLTGDLAIKMDQWASQYEANFNQRCSDETCKIGIRFVKTGTVLYAKQQNEKTPAFTYNMMGKQLFEADRIGNEMVADSLARQSMASANGWAILAQAVWAKQCADKICFDAVNSLAKLMVPRAKQIASANPDESSSWVTGRVGQEIGPQFKKAVDASKARMGK